MSTASTDMNIETTAEKNTTTTQGPTANQESSLADNTVADSAVNESLPAGSPQAPVPAAQTPEELARDSLLHLALYNAAREIVLEEQVRGSLPDQLNTTLSLLQDHYLPAQFARTNGAFLGSVLEQAASPNDDSQQAPQQEAAKVQKEPGKFMRMLSGLHDAVVGFWSDRKPDLDAPAQEIPSMAEAQDSAAPAPLSLVVASLREGIVNALCHRDYGSSDPVSIHVFPKYIEVRNPCRLPAGMNTRQLLPAGVSLPGNNQLLELFVQAGLAQGTGQGLKTMRATWKQAGYPVPRIFLAKAQTKQEGQPDSCGTFTLHFACVPPKVSDSLRKVQQTTKAYSFQVLALLAETPRHSIRGMAKLTGLSVAQIRNALRYLREIGLIARVGNNRSGSWKVFPTLQADKTNAALQVLLATGQARPGTTTPVTAAPEAAADTAPAGEDDLLTLVDNHAPALARSDRTDGEAEDK